MEGFNTAWGSVTGSKHYTDRKNGQDAYSMVNLPNLFVSFVADGCGDPVDSPYSEVGARIGARMAVKMVSEQAKKLYPNNLAYLTSTQFWSRVQQDMLASIRVLAVQMGESLSEVVSKHFLFTLVGVVMTPEVTVFVTIGDGWIIVNDEFIRVGPFPDNMPVYLAYNLIDTKLKLDSPSLLNFTVQRSLPTHEVESFLIGSDGIDDLIEAEEKPIPGKDELVGPISQFWTNPLFFTNPFAAGHRLTLCAREVRIIDWINRRVNNYVGLLTDDTTLITGSRIY